MRDNYNKIAILTYNVRHRKTFDTLCLLKANGYENVSVYATPLHYKKSFRPLIEHRPAVGEGIPETSEICSHFSYEYWEGNLDSFHISQNDILLICGAGILPEKFIDEHCIINSHPGYIPDCRGLDSYKWAIYEGHPIGVTTHFVGRYVDAGEIIERRIIPIQHYDTFHSVAQKVYESEVSMLVGALKKLDEPHEIIIPDNIVHRRMPHDIERKLLLKFEEQKEI